MKKLLFLCMVCISFTMQSQNLNFQPTDFYDFYKKFDSLNPNFFDDTTLTGSQKDFYRNFTYWGAHLYPHGDFKVVVNAMHEYATSFNSSPLSKQSGINASWTRVGKPYVDTIIPYVGQIHRITFDPQYNGTTNKNVYASSSHSGLWQSVDGGENWSLANTDQQIPLSSVSDVAVDHYNSQNIFIATGGADGGIYWDYSSNWGSVNPLFTTGVYRSTDFGQNWYAINDSLMDDFANGGIIRRMIASPSDSNQLFLATSSGIFRTNNALSANPYWDKVYVPSDSSGNDTELRGIEFKPGNTNVVYASGKDIYGSTNNGTSWSSITGSGTGLDLKNLPHKFKVKRINIATTVDSAEILYAYIKGNDTLGVKSYIYYYNGTTWTKVGTHFFDVPSWIAIAASPVSWNRYFFGDVNLRAKTDTIEDAALGLIHDDVHDIVFEPNNTTNPRMFVGTHGGVSVKAYGGIFNTGWTPKSNGLENELIWTFDDYKLSKNMTVTAQQDNGTHILINSGADWTQVDGADGYGIMMSQNSDTFILANTNSTRLVRVNYANASAVTETYKYENPSWKMVPQDPFNNGANGKEEVFPTMNGKTHPVTDSLIVGFSNLYVRKKKLPQSGDTWSDLWGRKSDLHHTYDWKGTRRISEFEISPSNPNYIYAASPGQDNVEFTYSRLFRSTSGLGVGTAMSPVFEEITDNLPKISNYPPLSTFSDSFPVITGLAVHPKNHLKLWVTFAGYDPDIKVWTSNDGGNTWSSYASGTGNLQYLAINGIVYQEGTDDRLYIATDVGVFVRDSTMSDWEKYGDMPNVRVMELKINPCENKIKAATFGRGLFEAELLESNGVDQERVISSNMTYTNKSLLQNLRITNNSTLTITGTLRMPANGKIIVEKGSKLVVDGGTITNGCGKMWAGIEVQGTRDTSQLVSSAQGTVELKNSAIIENAWNAITTIKTDAYGNWDWTGTGGIIRADSVTFRNNWRDIQMLSYHNKNLTTGAAMNNVSYFYNCTFTTTSLLNDTLAKPIAHVTLFDVDGLRFYGCKFIYNAGAAYQLYERRTGIKSIDARYTVTCLKNIDTGNCTSTGDSKFDGLYYGIEAQNSIPSQTVTVNNTKFNLTSFGILLKGVNYATITENSFTPADNGWGIYLDMSSGYEIENNTFNGESGGSIGTYHYNNGKDNNKVYKNTFNSLEYGSMMSQLNGVSNIKKATGLEYKCNKYSSTTIVDIGITSGKVRKVWGTDAISPQAKDAANNFFSYNVSLGDVFANNWVDTFLYSFVDDNSYNLEPRNGYFNPGVTVLNPITGSIDTSQYCPKDLAGTKSKAEIKGTISALRTSRDSVANIIDGGKTSMMLTMISNDDPENEIQDTLLTYSPYLSDEVLLAAIQDVPTPLNSDVLRYILVANSPLSEAIWDSAQTRDPAMDNDHLEEIGDLQTGEYSPRDTLEMIISLHQGEVELATNDLVRHFLNDTSIIGHLDSVKVTILSDPNRRRADLEYAEILIAQADSAALDTLVSIASNYTDWSNYFLYLEEAFSLKTNPSLSQDSAFLAYMRPIADTTATKECAFAQAILENFDTLNFPEIIETLYELERIGKLPDEPQLSGYISPIVFDAYPNPYNQKTEINYLLPENANQPQLMIVEMASGKLVRSYQLAENKGKVSISEQELSNGVYLYYITTSNGRSKVKKLVKTN